MPFYNPEEIESREMPGRKREMVVVGKNLQLMLIERHQASAGGHSHLNEQMLYLLEGKARFRLGEEERVVGPGEVVYVPSNLHHELELLTPTIRYVEIFSPPLAAEGN